MTPLISVMMPSYNAAQTLPMALTSLLLQSYNNWECILIDDGSVDNTEAVVSQLHDPRIHYKRFVENKGRGVARQAALEQARGKYLCMLDADDWYYMDKLQLQVEIMEQDRNLVLLSTGMAVVDSDMELTGVRYSKLLKNGRGVKSKLVRLQMPPFAHAPSMICMRQAKQAEYDPRFLLAQDVDYLLKVTLNQTFYVLTDITYVYSELQSVNVEKITAALQYTRQMFRKYRSIYPVDSYLNDYYALLKSWIYRTLNLFGLEQKMLLRRSLLPTSAHYVEYQKQKETIVKQTKQLFDTEILT